MGIPLGQSDTIYYIRMANKVLLQVRRDAKSTALNFPEIRLVFTCSSILEAIGCVVDLKSATLGAGRPRSDFGDD
jgi:hypothetical protein